MTRVVVIGGGIAGLAAARELARRGREVLVLEAAERPGGVIRSERVDGYLCEHAANGFLDQAGEPGGPSLARELGVEVVAAAPAAKRRWVFRRGALRVVPTGPPGLITTGLLSARGKLRLLFEPLVGRAKGGEESVASFARRRLGREAAEAVVGPFVSGIYAGDPEQLSVQAALPRLAALEAEHGGLVRGLIASRKPGKRAVPSLVTPREGTGALVDALARELGGALRCGARVTALERAGAGWRVRAGDDTVEAGAVALALPPAASAALAEPLDPGLAAALRAFELVPALVAFAGFARVDVSHPLDGFGFLVAAGEPLRCLGCLFETSTWPGRAPAGHVLLRLIYGGARDRAVVDLDDDAVRTMVRADLAASIGLRAELRFLRVRRHRAAIAQYNLGHGARVAEAERRAAALGLVLAGSAYHGVSVNECVKDAARVATLVEDVARRREAA